MGETGIVANSFINLNPVHQILKKRIWSPKNENNHFLKAAVVEKISTVIPNYYAYLY